MISLSNTTPPPSNSPPPSRSPKDAAAITYISKQLRRLTASFPLASVIEIRAIACTEKYKPRPHTIAGFFDLDHIDEAAAAAFDLQFKLAKGVYFTLNPINPDLLSRRANRVEAVTESDAISAADPDIVRRHWILVDADPVRTSGVSSSEAEKAAALSTINAVEQSLGLDDWPNPIKADSGNGYHLLYRVDLPNDEAVATLVRNCLRALAAQHDSDAVKIDTVVYNAARICKLYGTISRKGDHTPERPHRFSKILSSPGTVEVVPEELLQKLAAEAPPEKTSATAKSGGRRSSGERGGRRGNRGSRSADPVKAAAAYLAKVPPAISGQGGHSRLYHAAGVLIDGFALSIDDALPLLQTWNITCQPPWSDADLERKLLEAEKNFGRSGKLIKEMELPTLPARPVVNLQELQVIIDNATGDTPDAPLATAPAQKTSSVTIPPDLSLSFVENRNDLTNGRRLARIFGHEIRFAHAWNSWLCYTGSRWSVDATAEMHRKSKQISQALWDEVFSGKINGDEIDEALSFAKYSSSVRAIGEMMRAASSEPGIPVVASDLDANNWVLNCPNGTLDLRSGTLRPHSPDDLISKISATPFVADAPCPIWESFLSDIFDGNAELIAYIQRLLGYCLTGDVSEHVLAVFHGGGENGKSTLLNAIMELIGEHYFMKAPTDFLMSKYGDSHPTEKADLFGRRLVSASETKEGQRLDEALVKELTGGDKVRARRMREDFWEFQPTHKLILTTNHPPMISGTDRGIWRRMRLIPFTVTIPAEKKDRTLPEKLRAEYPGILAWMVRGCLEWQKGGLRDPNEVLMATTEYRSTQDTLKSFIDEHCLAGLDMYRVRLRKLYQAYHTWMKEAGELPVSEKRFSMVLTQQGYKKERSDGIWFTGICLKDSTEESGSASEHQHSDDPF